MTSAFSTNDTECLSRSTEHQLAVESLEEIWNQQRLSECVNWLNEHHYDKVCIELFYNNFKMIFISIFLFMCSIFLDK